MTQGVERALRPVAAHQRHLVRLDQHVRAASLDGRAVDRIDPGRLVRELVDALPLDDIGRGHAVPPRNIVGLGEADPVVGVRPGDEGRADERQRVEQVPAVAGEADASRQARQRHEGHAVGGQQLVEEPADRALGQLAIVGPEAVFVHADNHVPPGADAARRDDLGPRLAPLDAQDLVDAGGAVREELRRDDLPRLAVHGHAELGRRQIAHRECGPIDDADVDEHDFDAGAERRYLGRQPPGRHRGQHGVDEHGGGERHSQSGHGVLRGAGADERRWRQYTVPPPRRRRRQARLLC